MAQTEGLPDVRRFVKKIFMKVAGLLFLILFILIAWQLNAGTIVAGGFWALVSPWTVGTKITFIDETTKEPVPDLSVVISWIATNGTCVDAGSSWNYHQQTLLTDARGLIELPREKKPFPIVLCPMIYRGHIGTDIKIESDSYKLVKRLKDQEEHVVIGLQRRR